MSLPDYNPSKYKILSEGKYIFQITSAPTKKRFGKAIAIVFEFSAVNWMGGRDIEEASVLMWPWDESYGQLKELIGSSEEMDWLGFEFIGEIVHETIKGKVRHKIVNVSEHKEGKGSEPETAEEEGDAPPPPPRERKPIATRTKHGEDGSTTIEEDYTEENPPLPTEEDAPPAEGEDEDLPF